MQQEIKERTLTEKKHIQHSDLEACSFIKTALMLIVVIYHSILYWRGTWFDRAPVYQAEPLGWAALWMNSFHVYGFTLVSGYIFYYVKYQLGRYKQYQSFLMNKCRRLLVPYAFIAALWVIPFERFLIGIDFGDVVRRYIFGESPSQLWFLLMLFDVFAIMWPLSDFMRRKNVCGGMVVAGLYLTGMICQRFAPNVLQIWTACMYCLFFWIGMKLCQYAGSTVTKALKRIPAYLWVVLDIALFVMIRMMPESNPFLDLAKTGLNLFLNIFGAVMSFVLFQKLYEVFPWKENKAFSRLGKYSFHIYLFHQQLVYCAIIAMNGKINPYIHAIFNVFIAFSGSFIISWGLLRLKATSMLLGGKKV